MRVEVFLSCSWSTGYSAQVQDILLLTILANLLITRSNCDVEAAALADCFVLGLPQDMGFGSRLRVSRDWVRPQDGRVSPHPCFSSLICCPFKPPQTLTLFPLQPEGHHVVSSL